MTLYAESSAILAWLIDEPGAEAVRSALAAADRVVASDLTLVECDRVLLRAIGQSRLTEADAQDCQSQLNTAAAHWTILGLGREVVDRARRPFPVEPIRALDALHLSSALAARRFVPGLALLSLDQRVRSCGRRMGFQVLPEGA